MRSTLLVLVNAFAAAACFVGALFLASIMPAGLIQPATVVLGLVATAHFSRRAHEHRARSSERGA